MDYQRLPRLCENGLLIGATLQRFVGEHESLCEGVEILGES